MATKKNLYQVLQVPRNATPDVIKTAYEKRLNEQGTSAAPEVVNERNLLRQANEILSDPNRRKHYDTMLLQESARAAGSGGDALAAPATPVMTQRAAPTTVSASVVWIILVAFLGIAGAGVWIYLDHKRNALLARQLKEKQAMEDQKRLEALLDDPQRIDWGKTPYDPNRARVDSRYEESYRSYERSRYQYEQNRQAREQAYASQRAAMQQRQADYQRQREEQENIRRQQQQLENDKRHLRELESQRPQRF